MATRMMLQAQARRRVDAPILLALTKSPPLVGRQPMSKRLRECITRRRSNHFALAAKINFLLRLLRVVSGGTPCVLQACSFFFIPPFFLPMHKHVAKTSFCVTGKQPGSDTVGVIAKVSFMLISS
jgi:hypothetical protein